jgi:hypothetical protein
MNRLIRTILSAILCLLFAGVGIADAKVTAQEAEQLKTTLTPLGGEKAGNQDGTIPAWNGGYTTPVAGFVNGGRRPNPFKDDKVLFTITAQNMNQYADKLSEADKALLKKYPDTYRINVYPTLRTAAAPQYVYDNTYANATRSYLEGYNIKDAFGGIPFPVPKTGLEVMWNSQLYYRPSAWHFYNDAILGTSSGKLVLLNEAEAKQMMPYYREDLTLDTYKKDWDGEYWMLRLIPHGPPMKVGEGILGRQNLTASKTGSWLYMTGQRRVRRLPNGCCDTPLTTLSGVTFYDEIEVFTGSDSITRFNWKIVGKKEMYIPYNCNKIMEPRDTYEVVHSRHLNPDYVRYELHRVWVIEATLVEGMRHQCPRSLYYMDEDTWIIALSDRYDANGELWRSGYSLPMVLPDLPGVVPLIWGFFDIKTGTWIASNLYNKYDEQFKVMPPYKDSVFTPASLEAEGIR